MNVILNKALSMKNKGVILREPLPKDKLANELSKFRALLYKGDPGETYCLAVGESQAAGVPCVVKDVGCVAERIINGITGYVAKDDNTFINQALSILKDDKIWRSQHQAALIYQRKWNWDDASKLFEQLI